MDQRTDEFLRAEYEAAWAHIREIDNRRLRFVEFYISLNALLATAITAIIGRTTRTALTFGNVVLVFVGTMKTPTELTQNLAPVGGTLKYVFRFFFGAFAIWAAASLTILVWTLIHKYG